MRLPRTQRPPRMITIMLAMQAMLAAQVMRIWISCVVRSKTQTMSSLRM